MGEIPLALSSSLDSGRFFQEFQMPGYGTPPCFDHRQPEVSKFFQSEGSHFRAQSEFNNRIHMIQMRERHRHRVALQVVDHRGLLLSDGIRGLSQQNHHKPYSS